MLQHNVTGRKVGGTERGVIPVEQVASPVKRMYSINEFMTAYGMSRTRTYAEINAGRLVARRIGGRTMIASDDADSWLAALPRYQPARAA